MIVIGVKKSCHPGVCDLLPPPCITFHVVKTQNSLPNDTSHLPGSEWAFSSVCSLSASVGLRNGLSRQLEAVCQRRAYKKSAGGVNVRTGVFSCDNTRQMCYRTIPRVDENWGRWETNGQGPRHLRIGNFKLVFQVIMSIGVYLSK